MKNHAIIRIIATILVLTALLCTGCTYSGDYDYAVEQNQRAIGVFADAEELEALLFHEVRLVALTASPDRDFQINLAYAIDGGDLQNFFGGYKLRRDNNDSREGLAIQICCDIAESDPDLQSADPTDVEIVLCVVEWRVDGQRWDSAQERRDTYYRLYDVDGDGLWDLAERNVGMLAYFTENALHDADSQTIDLTDHSGRDGGFTFAHVQIWKAWK